jgi:hypothetical protein
MDTPSSFGAAEGRNRRQSVARKKTWQEKLHDNKGLPKIGPNEGKLYKHWGAGTHVVPAPLEVDELMRKVKKGRVTTIDHLRAALAKKHGVHVACPITTGIFAWISAHAADEAEQGGRMRVTPYWRTLKSGGELNAKYPGGIENLRRRLEAEGHTVTQRGKRYFVADVERRLATF